ncbi:hypothetical protein IQ06DRAFT_48811 [Phaeosphaeriaceae sp. SRC1lsM3a]|nr:hypothetical protein IQ06DRAFT_48811 [Stagonospora sp. SRC1lsM3a]
MSISASDKPCVLILSLGTNSSFNEFYQSILEKLNTRAAIDYATSPDSVLQTLAVQPPQVVLVTDGSVTQHRNVCTKLLDYVHGGGILVLMGDFSSSIRPDDLDKFFQEAGLPWTKAEYLRTTVYRNDTERPLLYSSLPSSYSQKAVFLANVSINDAWYLPTDSSRTESLVFHSRQVRDKEQTPVALAKIGNGKLGYVGDVNGEEGSDAVVLAMCGL